MTKTKQHILAQHMIATNLDKFYDIIQDAGLSGLSGETIWHACYYRIRQLVKYTL